MWQEPVERVLCAGCTGACMCMLCTSAASAVAVLRRGAAVGCLRQDVCSIACRAHLSAEPLSISLISSRMAIMALQKRSISLCTRVDTQTIEEDHRHLNNAACQWVSTHSAH